MRIHPQQRKLMKAAGFRVVDSGPSFVVWGRGEIRVGLNYSRPVSLHQLINYIVSQCWYRSIRAAKQQFSNAINSDGPISFAFENEKFSKANKERQNGKTKRKKRQANKRR